MLSQRASIGFAFIIMRSATAIKEVAVCRIRSSSLIELISLEIYGKIS